MRMEDALKIINKEENEGYMVTFEWIEGGILRSDHFPDKHAGETLIKTEGEAWEMAVRFAYQTKGRTCNVYVIDSSFGPVGGYKEREIKNR